MSVGLRVIGADNGGPRKVMAALLLLPMTTETWTSKGSVRGAFTGLPIMRQLMLGIVRPLV